ncbi:hypothetical protein PFISCL1PPCAC_9645, partial [Pristionchus fissidentatus]
LVLHLRVLLVQMHQFLPYFLFSLRTSIGCRHPARVLDLPISSERGHSEPQLVLLGSGQRLVLQQHDVRLIPLITQ